MPQVKSNVVYHHLLTSDKRIVIEQGGARSGKTYNILLWLIFSYCKENRGKTISIARKTYPALRASAMRDFISILSNYGLYEEKYHNKSNGEYILFGNLVEFLSLDQPQKVRGRKRNVLFINEANELTIEDWRQLSIRTTDKIVMDYNPSEEFHWIYDELIPREDSDFFQTNYRDNPFLEQSLVDELERLKDIDENYWRVYGLGERGQSKAVIFQFQQVKQIPSTARLLAYGLDWGYSVDPTAVVASYIDGENLYFNEVLYQTGMTNADIAKSLANAGIDRRDVIYADSAEPKSITDLHRFGFNVKPTTKGADSINAGIDLLKRYRLHWTESSINGIKEMRNYKWADDKNGKLLSKPVDAFNHTMDAMRYATYNSLNRPTYGKYSVR